MGFLDFLGGGLGGMLGGAGGAALGTLLLPGIGTIIGGALGGAVGGAGEAAATGGDPLASAITGGVGGTLGGVGGAATAAVGPVVGSVAAPAASAVAPAMAGGANAGVGAGIGGGVGTGAGLGSGTSGFVAPVLNGSAIGGSSSAPAAGGTGIGAFLKNMPMEQKMSLGLKAVGGLMKMGSGSGSNKTPEVYKQGTGHISPKSRFFPGYKTIPGMQEPSMMDQAGGFASGMGDVLASSAQMSQMMKMLQEQNGGAMGTDPKYDARNGIIKASDYYGRKQ